jgi:hypothetical protein
MPNRRLLAIEAGLVTAAVCVVLLIVFWPFGSSADDGSPVGGRLPSVSVPGGDNGDGAPIRGVERPGTGERPQRHQGCTPELTTDFMVGNFVLAYYGNPYTPVMGIVGQHEPDELGRLLREHADEFREHTPKGVLPAIHIVYGVAQTYPGEDGLYLLYVDDETMEEYIDFACENGMLVILDLQIGRSDAVTEVQKVLRYLEEPHVHLALDPEFAMGPGEVPGEVIGGLDADEINAVQALVQGFVEGRNLPDKMIIVHQFVDQMIQRPEAIENFPNIRFVIDMDGFGPSAVKREKYLLYSRPAEYGGLKLFFEQDDDLMPIREILRLRPNVVIYQ